MKHEKTVFAIAALFIVMGYCAPVFSAPDGVDVLKVNKPQRNLSEGSDEKVPVRMSVTVKSIERSVFENELQTEKRPVKRNPVFWFMAVAALISALAAVMIRNERLCLGAAFLSMILAAFATLWSDSFWFPVFPGALLTVVVGWFASGGGVSGKERGEGSRADSLSRHVSGYDEPDDALEDGVELWTFVAGAALSLAAAGLWIRKEGFVFGGALPAGIAFVVLVLFVWRLRQPVALWGLTFAVGYLAWMFGPVLFRHPETFLGGGIFLFGCMGAFIRKEMNVSVLFGGIALVGIMVAVSGWAGSMWRQPVGWTIGVGLPVVFVALGSALAQKGRFQGSGAGIGFSAERESKD